MLKHLIKRSSMVFYCLLSSVEAEAWPRPAVDSVYARLSLAETYACTLNVWNKEIKPGAHDVKLTGFKLHVNAAYLGSDSVLQALVAASPSQLRFWLHRLELQYLPAWQIGSDLARKDSTSAEADWSKVTIRMNDGRVLALRQLTAQDTLAQIAIQSTLAMSRNDLMRLGVFHFQPGLPGIYELRFQLTRKGRLAFATRQRVEFFCPLAQPQIAVAKDGALHEVSNAYIHIPLIASTFFEPGSPWPNGNETDRLFRSMFLGVMAKRLACAALPASLVMLDDFASGLDTPTRLDLAKRRADHLLAALTEKARAPCEDSSNPRGRESDSIKPDSACRSLISQRMATSAEAQYYLKINESEVSPQWFAEENRVVPLVAAPEVQRIIFEPLKIKPQEESDYVEFQCLGETSAAMLKCLRGGMLEVTSERGEKCRQEISAGKLDGALRGHTTLRLDAPQMNAFLTPGEYNAVLKLAVFASPRLLESNVIRFRIARKQIVRDEVFALSPYDRVDLTYDLDRERVARIGREVLKGVREGTAAASPEILVLITGHSDSLGEHRAQGVGRYYNLGLSFGRALHLKKIFTDSLLASAAQAGSRIKVISENLLIPPVLQESVRKHLGGTIKPGGKRAKGEPSTNGQKLDDDEEFLDLVIHEKTRHFRARAGNVLPAPIPAAAEILARCEALRALLPLEISTLALSMHGHKRLITIAAVGFGAAVPFYRQMELSQELREIFCQMEYRPEEIPAHLFGRDRYPAGRLMNRRVELNVIW